MHVNALNSNSQSPALIVHGPTKSTATSFHQIVFAIRGGKWPYPCPACFHQRQLSGQINCSQATYNPGAANCLLIVLYNRCVPECPRV